MELQPGQRPGTCRCWLLVDEEHAWGANEEEGKSRRLQDSEGLARYRTVSPEGQGG